MRSHQILGLAAAILLSACAPEPNLVDQGLPRLERPSEVLFWSQAEREAGFRAMERIAPHRTVSAGGEVRALPPGDPLDLDVDGFMEAEKVAGLLVLQDGRRRWRRPQGWRSGIWPPKTRSSAPPARNPARTAPAAPDRPEAPAGPRPSLPP